MKIVACSDLHNSKDLYWKLLYKKGDLLIIAGDLTSLGRELELTLALNTIDECDFKYKIVVLGNHEKENQYEFCKSKYPNIIFLNNEIIEIEGLKIYGSPYSKRFYNWAFPYDTIDECVKYTIPKEEVDIIVTHEPPSHEKLSYTYDPIDIGNNELRKYIENTNKNILVISGHVHERGGNYVKINNSICYNVSRKIIDIEL